MDIGTAKPTKAQQGEVPHHMLDLIEPDRFYSAAEYKRNADLVLERLASLSQIPIVCGGTGLYARALLEGIEVPEVSAQSDMRLELNLFAEQHGNEALHQKLRSLDSVAAERLNVNDRIRIIRAIEVTTVMGKPFSQLATKTKPKHRTLWIGLHWSDRSKLKQAISDRLDFQMKLGLLEEVKSLFDNKAYRDVLVRAINYKEFRPYLDGTEKLEVCSNKCVTDTYQLSRKQMIWFRANPLIKWFAVDELRIAQIGEQILNLYAQARTKRD
jgi:tRNA dimethylallyltransferase